MDDKFFADFLIIDDDRMNNEICSKIIETTFPGVIVHTFNLPVNGLEFMENIDPTNARPLVLLLDINMPEINGWAVLERFTRLDEQVRKMVKIYMLSSSICPEDHERVATYPFVSGFISKPLSQTKLKKLFQEPDSN